MTRKDAKQIAKAIQNRFNTAVNFSEWRSSYDLELSTEVEETELWYYCEQLKEEFFTDDILVENGNRVTIYK